MRSWQSDSNLTSVRDNEALTKLPEDERKNWTELWDDVAALLKRAESRQ
jgi:hypothetical protein